MSNPTKLIEDLLLKVKDLQGQTFAFKMKGDDFKLPRLIPGKDDNGPIQITKEVDDLITSLAQSLKLAQPQIAKSVKDDEWRLWVRTAIGPLLAATSPPTIATPTAASVLTQLNHVLVEMVSDLAAKEYAFGTRLFSNGDVPFFTIGPVDFEPRDIWLDRKVVCGEITLVTQRRVRRSWAGKRLSRRKSNLEQMREEDILKVIGPCPYVCTVKLVSSFAANAGLETALTTARLGLACAALPFETPSRVLRGFNLNYDGPVHLQIALSFIANKKVLAGRKLSQDPHGPFVKVEDWQQDLTRFGPTFSSCGEVLDRLVNPNLSTKRDSILNALLQSLMWFEKGCREVGDLMGIVGFAASLDALGKGMKAPGILEVLEARLGIKSTDPVYPHGPEFKTVIEKIYSEGRSRTVHGTSDKIGFDWSQTRILAEQIARLAVIACLDYIAQNASALTPDDFKRP